MRVYALLFALYVLAAVALATPTVLLALHAAEGIR